VSCRLSRILVNASQGRRASRSEGNTGLIGESSLPPTSPSGSCCPLMLWHDSPGSPTMAELKRTVHHLPGRQIDD